VIFVKFDDTKNWKGKGDIGKSKTGGHDDLKKNQYAYCEEVGHWKIDCTKLNVNQKESKSESKIIMAVDNDSDSSSSSLSVTPIVCYSE